MSSAFRLSADPRRSLLLIELSGFFEATDVSRFAAEKQAAHRDLMCAPNEHVTIVDVTDCKIQGQAVVGAFAAMIADQRYKGRKLAFVTGSSLAKMQVRRLIEGQAEARCFDNRRLAEAWLMEDGAAAPLRNGF